MNIAFPALVIFLIVMPGVIFRRARFGNLPLRQKQPIAEEIGLSVVFAGLIQVLWLLLSNSLSGWTGVEVNLRAVLVLSSGHEGEGENSYDAAIKSVAENPLWISLYFGSLYAIAYISGFVARYLGKGLVRPISDGILDRLHSVIGSNWVPEIGGTACSALQLSGSLDSRDDDLEEAGNRRYGQWLRSCELPEETKEELGGSDVLLLEVAAVVELGGRPFLFRGFVDKAFFGIDGELELITLRDVRRRVISESESGSTEQDENRYYHVKSDHFVLRLKETKTINFQYFAVFYDQIAPDAAADPHDAVAKFATP